MKIARRLVRPVAFAAAFGVLGTQTGCFGKFGAVDTLYTWNKGVSGNKFVRWLVFFGLCVIPVYELFLIGDWLIFNSIEFWFGSNPIGGGSAEVKVLEDGTVEIARNGARYQLVPEGDKKLWLLKDGRRLGRAELQDDGAFAFVDLVHERTMLFTAEEMAAVGAAVNPTIAMAE